MKTFKQFQESWSNKYKKSIDCSNPKGFSQKAHCAGRKKEQQVVKLNLNQLNEQSSYPKKTWSTSKFKNIRTFIRMKIQKARFMDLGLRMLRLLKHLLLRFVIHQDLMLTKSRQLLLWNKEQEKWVRLQRQQSIVSLSTQ